MFKKVKNWFASAKVRALGVISTVMMLAQNGTVDFSQLTSVMTTLIYAILPLLVIVMVFKVFGSVVKSLGDIF